MPAKEMTYDRLQELVNANRAQIKAASGSVGEAMVISAWTLYSYCLEIANRDGRADAETLLREQIETVLRNQLCKTSGIVRVQ